MFPDLARTIPELVQQKILLIRKRTIERRRVHYRLKSWQSTEDLPDHVSVGAFAKILTDEEVWKMERQSGDEKRVDVGPDEGICQKTMFLFDQQLGVLMIQRNSNGPSSSALVDYINYFADLFSVTKKLILLPDALERVEDGLTIKDLTIHLADLTNIPHLRSEFEVWDEMVNALQRFNAHGIQLKMIMGERVKPKSFKEMFGFFSSHEKRKENKGKEEDETTAEIDKAVVSIVDDHGDTRVIDLIEHKLVGIEEVDEKTNLYSLDDMIPWLIKQYEKQHDYLTSIFSAPRREDTGSLDS